MTEKPKLYSYMIQIKDPDVEPMIKEMAAEDMRTIGNETAFLIRKEYNARHPKTIKQLNTHAASMADKPC